MERKERKVLFLTIGTILIGVFFSFLSAISLHRSEKLAIQHEVQKDVENTAMSLSRELNIGIELLYALRNQFALVEQMDEATFVKFAEKSMDRHQNIRAMEWAEVVDGNEREHYEIDVSQDASSFKIVERKENAKHADLIEASERNRYFPVRYITPFKSNEHLLGFDLASNADMKGALEMSWYRGVPIATPNLRFKTALDADLAFIMLLPVFNGDPETNAQRKEALRGFLLVRFAVKDIFELATNNTVKESINLELLDKSANQEQNAIHRHFVDKADETAQALSFTSEAIFFAGRQWFIRGIPSAHYVQSRLSIAPHIIFLVGVFIFSLLAYIIYSLQHRALNIQQRVDAKTSQLRQANSKLEKMSMSDGLTGYHNKEYFDECTDAELKRAHRDRLPISLLFIDIDNIAGYNELNGRVAGDRIIRLIGHAASDILKRPGDLLSRYEGGMFSVLLPNTKDGAPIAELCLCAIQNLKIPFDLQGNIVTVSIGGVTVIDSQEVSADKLVTYAQIALGKAIAGGRNQSFWLYNPEEETAKKGHDKKGSK